MKAGNSLSLSLSLSDARLKIAREYGFPSWSKLKGHIDWLEEAGQLKDTIKRNGLQGPLLFKVRLDLAESTRGELSEVFR